MVPSGPVVIDAVPENAPVAAGDLMNASVTSTGAPGTYILTITNETWGWSYSTTQTLPSAAGAVAECLEERPDAAGLPLADFGSVTFTNCEVTGDNGMATPIWDHANYALTMTNGNLVRANVSPLSDDGTQFTVTYVSG